MSKGFLLDVNVLLALTDRHHVHRELVNAWFDEEGAARWASCAMTQAGFIRLKTNPKIGGNSMVEAAETLRRLLQHYGHRFWPMQSGWETLAAPFAGRLFGHQQVTDACLLGLAVECGGVLVTLDRGVSYLAGQAYRESLLVLD